MTFFVVVLILLVFGAAVAAYVECAMYERMGRHAGMLACMLVMTGIIGDRTPGVQGIALLSSCILSILIYLYAVLQVARRQAVEVDQERRRTAHYCLVGRIFNMGKPHDPGISRAD